MNTLNLCSRHEFSYNRLNQNVCETLRRIQNGSVLQKLNPRCLKKLAKREIDLHTKCVLWIKLKYFCFIFISLFSSKFYFFVWKNYEFSFKLNVFETPNDYFFKRTLKPDSNAPVSACTEQNAMHAVGSHNRGSRSKEKISNLSLNSLPFKLAKCIPHKATR